ncbi:dystonin-like isoform X2 [Watersipora subatra]|uniref:dystonin-like isoform X2 n=1 Tax=Watersipora subatra TaxID=2589382 RepID=UPI00355B7698
MTPCDEVLRWLRETKKEAESWEFGSNPRDIRVSVSKNRDAIGIIDSYSYQINMALHQEMSREEKMRMNEDHDELKDILAKRSECLEIIGQVSKMEDLFSTLALDIDSTALGLAEKAKDSLQSTKPKLNLYSSSVLAENCVKSLQQSWSYLQSLAYCNQIHLQNSAHYHQFWHEVQESNEWLEYQLTKLPELQKRTVQGTSYQVKRTMDEMMKILKNYLQWQTRLDILSERAKHVVPLQARTEKLDQPIQAQVLVDYKTADFELQGEDHVTLVDNSDSKRWKVRVTGSSEEHTVPSIIILIPAPDSSAHDAAFRLKLQMLAMWSSTTKVLGRHVTHVLTEVFKHWNETNPAGQSALTDAQKDDLVKTLSYMDATLGCSLNSSEAYKDLVKKTQAIVSRSKPDKSSENKENDKVTVVVQVNYLQKFLQRYWDFWTYCDTYRVVLEQFQQPKKVYLCTSPDQLRYITTAHFVKFWDCDLENQSQAAVEEDLISMDQADAAESGVLLSEEESEEEYFESGTTELNTQTEEVIESEMEVETTFVITGIVSNPGEEPEKIISLQDAIDCGIIDPNRGLYINKATRNFFPIPQAMNEGLIKMGPKEEKKSEEKVKSAGIITVRTTRETKPYTVQQALDTSTGEMISAEQACRQGILDPDYGTYKDLKKGTIMMIGDAVQRNLVEIEYEVNNNSMVLEEVSKSYLVHAVICQKTQSKLPFHKAVESGIIEKDSGTYIHNITGERFFIVDAINRGFVKASESDEVPSLSLADLGRTSATDNLSSLRKKVLNPLIALRAMKPQKLVNGGT